MHVTEVSVIPELAWQLDCQLGEGPVWLADEAALRFVDIERGHLHRFDPASGTGTTIEVGGNPSFIVPIQDGGLLVGSQHGLHRLEGAALGEPLVTIPQPLHNRTNDATVDPAGRLWFGTMDDGESRPTGSIWCLHEGALHSTDVGAIVTNGPAASGNGRVLYHVDSGERTIWRSRIDGVALRETEVFVQLDAADGHPDGIVTDTEDCLWVALWDGWGVRRYAPDGTLLLHVSLPCARVTKIAFGGPDLRTAYVTTARVGLDEAALAAQPLAGSLLAFTAPVAGRILPSVRLSA
ncbi:SMP-30/gluconolactonase/LRE family protein [Novosphingobium sp.]|uniref:SMP-30/gluconolactonase/LRE family protein n=1 Tax=Novosphingobium sp. TaxID=1874826 RepID=UPI0025D63977|nr:SMP-30/gluconolactonase/LRE family protein [Novosphingobium sp.]